MGTLSVISNEADFALFKHFGFRSARDVDKFADYPAEFYAIAEKRSRISQPARMRIIRTTSTQAAGG